MRMKTWMAAMGLAAMFAAPVAATAAQAADTIEVFKNPNCGCCGHWVEYLKQSGFAVRVHDVDDVGAARKRLGMPDKYAACHSAKVGGYAVEGHVPAADIKRLLAERPRAVGIAVPSMPPGSPGMPSPKPVPFDTLLVGADGGHRVFARH